MTLPVCAVQCYVYTQDGDPEPGATISAKLTHYEVYQGHIVPEEMTAITDENGLAVLSLWPNQLGSTGSSYKVKVQPVGKSSLTVYAVVPLASEASLADISTLPPYEGKPDGQAAVEFVSAAAASAAEASVSASLALISKNDAESAAATATSAAEDAAEAAVIAVSAKFSSLMNPRGEWATGVLYSVDADGVRDTYTYLGATYVVGVTHTSTTVAADEAAGYVWESATSQNTIDIAPVKSWLESAEYGMSGLAKIKRMMSDGLPVTIVCFGTSITYGSDSENPGVQVATPYPARLQTILRSYYKNANITVINHGYQGHDTEMLLDHIDEVMADSPDLVLLESGVNDARTDRTITLPAYAGNLKTILDGISPAVLAMVIATEVSGTGVTNGQAISAYRTAAKSFATQYNLDSIDLHATLGELLDNHISTRGQLNRDRLHWSLFGYSLIAESVFTSGLCNANIRMLPGQQKDIAQVPLVSISGTSTLTLANTLDTVEALLGNSSESRFFLWAPVGGCYLMAHARGTLDAASIVYQCTVQNLSLSGDTARTLATTTVVAGAPAAAISHALPFTVCRLRPGLNEVAFVTDASHTFMLSGFTVAQGPSVGFHPVWEEVDGLDLFRSSFSGLDTGGIKFLSSVVTGAGTGEFIGSDMLLPPPVGETYKVRVRGHFGQNATLRFGQALTVSDGYNCSYELIFAATQCLLRHRNRSDVTTAIATVSLSTSPSGDAHVIDFFQSAAGLTLYVDGVLIGAISHPLPAGRVIVDTGTTTVPSVIEYIGLLGADIAAGAAVPGERWMDHAAPALNMVNAAGSVVSVALV